MSCLKDFYKGQADLVAKKLEVLRPRGAWSKGVIGYADMLLTRYKDDLMVCETPKPYSLELALCGASNWLHFSEGGMGLGYPNRICEALLPPGGAKKCMDKDGPGPGVTWHQFEANALRQAFNLLQTLFDELT